MATRTARVKTAQELAIDGLKKLTARRETLLTKSKEIHVELEDIGPKIAALVKEITGQLTIEEGSEDKEVK